MISYEHFTLDNGLRVIIHQDLSIPTAVLNVMYDVGSKDESPDKTGFAHLFEHLMFGGSVNIPSYDTPLQKVGGSNNAFTSPDITNYYISLPYQNLETAFWLESDRMLSLAFDEKPLEIQKKVVIEEFKQRYINQPYGNIWHLIRKLAYKKHPYQWPTIGKEISHIENATLDDIKAFFYKHYRPCNAVLVVAGNVQVDQVKQLAEKWFGPIASGDKYIRNLTTEPIQQEARFLEYTADVPLNNIQKVWHMGPKMEDGYQATDLLSDILGRGKSSLLYSKLVKKEKLFSSLNAFISGSIEPGLFCIAGKLNEGVAFEEANEAIHTVIADFQQAGCDPKLLEKVKNQAEFSLTAGKSEILPRAIALAYGEIMGDANMVNLEEEQLRNVTAEEVATQSKQVLQNHHCSTLFYKSKPSASHGN